MKMNTTTLRLLIENDFMLSTFDGKNIDYRNSKQRILAAFEKSQQRDLQQEKTLQNCRQLSYKINTMKSSDTKNTMIMMLWDKMSQSNIDLKKVSIL